MVNSPHMEINCLNLGFVYDNVAVIVSPNSSCAEHQGKAWAGSFVCSSALAPKALHCVVEQMSSSLSSVTTQPGCSWHGAFRRDFPFIPEHRTWLLSYPTPRFPHWGMKHREMMLQGNGRALFSCPITLFTEKTSFLSTHNVGFPTHLSISREIKNG